MPKKVYDVCVVGSGASGGTLSAHLAHHGVDVAVVEGGPKINTRTAFNTHAMPFDFPNRHIPTMRPGVQGFESERSRGVGGKSMTWNAVAWRLSHRSSGGLNGQASVVRVSNLVARLRSTVLYSIPRVFPLNAAWRVRACQR